MFVFTVALIKVWSVLKLMYSNDMFTDLSCLLTS